MRFDAHHWTRCSSLHPLFFIRSSPSGVAMAFTRSLTSFLRASRLAASSSRANPVLSAFGRNPLQARSYATVFARDKPHVNVGRYDKANVLTSIDKSLQAPLVMSTTERYALAIATTRTSDLTMLDYTHRCHHQKTSRTRLCDLPRIWRDR